MLYTEGFNLGEFPRKFIFDKSENCYLVEFPDLKGCNTFGETIEDALSNAQEALTAYLESIDLRKIDIPGASNLKGKNIHYIKPEKNVAFAIWLKKTRISKGYSQKKMAKILNITFQSYQRYENPTRTNPTLKTISKLENVFNEHVLAI